MINVFIPGASPNNVGKSLTYSERQSLKKLDSILPSPLFTNTTRWTDAELKSIVWDRLKQQDKIEFALACSINNKHWTEWKDEELWVVWLDMIRKARSEVRIGMTQAVMLVAFIPHTDGGSLYFASSELSYSDYRDLILPVKPRINSIRKLVAEDFGIFTAVNATNKNAQNFARWLGLKNVHQSIPLTSEISADLYILEGDDK